MVMNCIVSQYTTVYLLIKQIALKFFKKFHKALLAFWFSRELAL